MLFPQDDADPLVPSTHQSEGKESSDDETSSSDVHHREQLPCYAQPRGSPKVPVRSPARSPGCPVPAQESTGTPVNSLTGKGNGHCSSGDAGAAPAVDMPCRTHTSPRPTPPPHTPSPHTPPPRHAPGTGRPSPRGAAPPATAPTGAPPHLPPHPRTPRPRTPYPPPRHRLTHLLRSHLTRLPPHPASTSPGSHLTRLPIPLGSRSHSARARHTAAQRPLPARLQPVRLRSSTPSGLVGCWHVPSHGSGGGNPVGGRRGP